MAVTQIPRPIITGVHRSRPGAVSLGDRATARLDPGLLEFLEAVTPPGTSAAGFVPRVTLPIGLAVTAAEAIVDRYAPPGIGWTGREVDVRVEGEQRPCDILEADAELTELTERDAWFDISTRTVDGRLLIVGRFRQIAHRSGVAVGRTVSEGLEAVRRRLPSPPPQPKPLAGRLRVSAGPSSIRLGAKGWLEIEVAGGAIDETLTVTAELPFGSGLTIEGAREVPVGVPANGRVHASFVVCADRPDLVNLGHPWELIVSAGADRLVVPIAVPDPDPGRICYVLTEDCETFDGGPATGAYGAFGAFGNQNNFMDPEDYRVQMIAKANRLNEIAERHGACWTHFVAITQRFAVEWAAARSGTGEWPKVAAELDASIRRGSKRHEYAPHIHFDYEPESAMAPQPRLVYDDATDGILPTDYWDPVTNPTHKYHDWDGAARGHVYLRALGQLDQLDTKAGSLRKSLRALARLQANRRAPLGARTGSFDFGATPEDEAISTQAYIANGLRGNSDAHMTASPCPPGGQMFWCRQTERTKPIDTLEEARLAQLAILNDTIFESADVINQWFEKTVAQCSGPGVHTMMVMTHAMFMRGTDDAFRSLEGGSFAELDRHLAWVRREHPEVRFVTFTEALLESLDYGSPTLEAWVEPVLSGGDLSAGVFEFPIRLLGRGIRVSPEYPAHILVKAPALFDGSEIDSLTLVEGDRVVAEASGFTDAALASVAATLDSRTQLRLRVRVKPQAATTIRALFADDDGIVRFADWPEPAERVLFECRAPRPGRAAGETVVSPGVVSLLMNAVAGQPAPLGRRVHPLGMFSVGAAIAAAREARPEGEVAALRLWWNSWPDLALDLVVGGATDAESATRWNAKLADPTGKTVATAVVEMRERR